MNNSKFFRIKKKLLKLIAKHIPGFQLRIRLLRMCGYEIGDSVYIGEDIIIIDDLDGAHSKFNLSVGDRAAISPRVTFIMHTKPNESRIAPYVNSHRGSICIEADAWIGTGAVILPNVTVGEGAVVGANSVVTKNVTRYTVVGGVPAHKIKEVDVPWNRVETQLS
jgi:maltose O-acetyltransferase